MAEFNTLTASELHRLVERAPWLVIDFETAADDPKMGTHPHAASPIGFSVLTPKGVGYVALHKPRGDGPYPLVTPQEAGEILRPLCSSVPIIGWNLKFDLHHLYRLTGVPVASPVDAMVGLWLLSEESELSLKGSLGFLLEAEFPSYKDILKMAEQDARERIKAQREEWAKAQKASGVMSLTEARKQAVQQFPFPKTGMWDIPTGIIGPYCNRDVAATALVWFAYVRPALERDGLLDYFYRYEMPFTDVLWSMEHAGIALDLERCQKLALDTMADITDLTSQIYAVAGCEFNISSREELCEVLFNRMGFEPPERRTKTGEISLDEKSMKDLLWKYQDKTNIFDLILAWRAKTKLQSTYAEALPAWAWKYIIHPQFNQTGAATGRLSCERPNLQNQPKKGGIRSIFKARPGKVLISADLSQAELRTIAHRTQDPKMIEVYRLGGDLHQKTMDGLGIEDRRIAKNANFGMAYGVGPKTFRETLLYQAGIRISEKEARQYIEGLYSTYSRINPWKERVWEYAARYGYVETLLGRRRHLPALLYGSKAEYGERAYAERQAVNVLIQGDVADMMRIAMIRVRPVFRQFGGDLLVQVHDEVLGEVDEAQAIEAARAIKEVMEGVYPDFSVPLVSDVELGQSWGEAIGLDDYIKAREAA